MLRREAKEQIKIAKDLEQNYGARRSNAVIHLEKLLKGKRPSPEELELSIGKLKRVIKYSEYLKTPKENDEMTAFQLDVRQKLAEAWRNAFEKFS